MKSISTFALDRPDIIEVEQDIYSAGDAYYIGLSFEQEPELGEGSSSVDISQYPLEDILDEYGVYVDDFCDEIIAKNSKLCKVVLASSSIDDLRSLKSIIGKHVYNASVLENGEEYIKLVVE